MMSVGRHKYLSHTHPQEGVTPLYLASEHGHKDVVDPLLKNGANPDLATKV